MQAPQMSAYAGTMITTELIQKYLDENKQLILTILDNQNLGKIHECAAYQSKLQQNLMYLAAIADAQPQAPMPSAQVAPGMLQANPQFMQPQQHIPAAMVDHSQQTQNYSQFQMAALQALQAQQRQQQQQQQQLQQQQRFVAAASAGIHMHSEIDLGGSNGNNMSGAFGDYASANRELMRNSSAPDLRTSMTASGEDVSKAAAGSSGAAAADGSGDDAGSTFLKASEEE